MAEPDALRVVYSRIPAPVHAALAAVAESAGVSVSKAIDATLCGLAGIEHPLTSHVNRAWSRHRNGLGGTNT
jgi:hypothetical protein